MTLAAPVPPDLPGYTFVGLAGSGGSSDVFLFDRDPSGRDASRRGASRRDALRRDATGQHGSDRPVAVKVARDPGAARLFQAEVELMRTLGTHPSILDVYYTGVAPDGRPYLVMEPCSAALGQRYRRERLPVDEVLSAMVRIGSALESAHRAGVLHRDVKPSNILLNTDHVPVLSDFGVASRVQDALGSGEAVGVSVPWAAPEVLTEETTGTVRSEVWSYAATVYSLLAGRSPFEVPGEPNRLGDLVARILKSSPRPIGRGDVPDSLELVLRVALSRDPADRQATVLELVEELRGVESELALPVTPVILTAPPPGTGTGRVPAQVPAPTPGSLTEAVRRPVLVLFGVLAVCVVGLGLILPAARSATRAENFHGARQKGRRGRAGRRVTLESSAANKRKDGTFHPVRVGRHPVP